MMPGGELEVSFGSFASLTRFSHVRSYPNSERFAGIPKVSLWAITGLMQRSKQHLAR
jgi:hypothetical protein